MAKHMRLFSLAAALCLLLSANAYADGGPAAEPSVLPDPAPPAEDAAPLPTPKEDEPVVVAPGESAILQGETLVISDPERDGDAALRLWGPDVGDGDAAITLRGVGPSLSLVDCDVTAGGRSVLSTGHSRGACFAAVDAALAVLSEGDATGAALLGCDAAALGSGCGAYCGPGSEHFFYGSDITGGAYGVIVDGAGSVWLGSSTGTIPLYDATGNMTGVVRGCGQATVIESVFGLYMRGDVSGSVTVDDGTVLHTLDAAVLYTGGSGTLRFNNARVTTENGVLLQMMDDDADERIDPASGLYDERDVGGAPGFPGVAYDQTPVPAASAEPDPALPPAPYAGERLTASYTNGLYLGDVYNGTGWYGQPGDSLDLTIGSGAVLFGDAALTSTAKAVPCTPGALEALDGMEDVRYTLLDEDGAPCEADEAAYIQFTGYTGREYYLQGHVCDLPCANGASSLDVTVAEGGVWVVRETSLVSRLTVEAGGTVFGRVHRNADGTVSLSPSPEKLRPGIYEPVKTPDPTPSATPTAEATPTPTAEATPTPTAEATPKPTAKATPTPTAEATPKPTAEATPTPTAKTTPTPTAEPTPTPKPRRRAASQPDQEVSYV